MAILVTNDDGYSIGFQALYSVAKKLDPKSYAVIPHTQRSAVASSLTLHKPLRLHQHREDSNIYELSGTPADCSLFALFSKEVPKPKLVLSGMNFGDNCGMTGLIGSGTVGACWLAATEGVPAIAFSMYRTSKEWRDRKNWGDVAKMEKKIEEVVKLLKPKLKPHMLFNVAFPNDLSKSKIVFNDRLQMRRFETYIDKRVDPTNMPYYWIYGNFSKNENGTDLYDVAVNKNIVISQVDLKKLANAGGIQ
jgi:5'-nucleotidase